MSLEMELIEAVHKESAYINKQITFMEVCGTHTMSIYKHGIKAVLPENIKLLSGPGCPVCVTPPQYIDQAIQLAINENTIICTFGDMIRVPGENDTLENTRAQGGDIRIVYSPLDCINIARKNPEKMIIFLAVGFETTSPVIGLAVRRAYNEGINNFFILPGMKLLFPALETLLSSGEINIDGLICPGHISAITGEKPYEFIPDKYKIPCVITGFESTEILMGIYMLVKQIAQGKACVENAYKRAGTILGNTNAIKIIHEVFKTVDDCWRGFSVIPYSGLEPSGQFEHHDARVFFKLGRPLWKSDGACCCGDVVKGLKTPVECPLFRKVCTPQSPVGACMVSAEGSCAASYKYNG